MRSPENSFDDRTRMRRREVSEFQRVGVSAYADQNMDNPHTPTPPHPHTPILPEAILIKNSAVNFAFAVSVSVSKNS